MYLTFSAHPNWAVLGREKQQRQRRERHWQQQQKQQQQQQLSLYLGMSCREHRTGREMPPPKSQPLISIWVVFLFSLSFSCCCCCWEEKETAREREVCFRKKSFLFCFERWFLYLFFSFGLLFLSLSLSPLLLCIWGRGEETVVLWPCGVFPFSGKRGHESTGNEEKCIL